MQQLYQWFRGRASLFRSGKSSPGTSQIVRTEVTVKRQSTTLLMSGATTFEVCPLCGQNLVPAQAEQARLRLHEGSTTEIPTNEFQPKLSTNNQLKGESQ
ncbi:MAG: hypothetical protein ABSC07_17275 [Terriglobales bacterium]